MTDKEPAAIEHFDGYIYVRNRAGQKMIRMKQPENWVLAAPPTASQMQFNMVHPPEDDNVLLGLYGNTIEIQQSIVPELYEHTAQISSLEFIIISAFLVPPLSAAGFTKKATHCEALDGHTVRFVEGEIKSFEAKSVFVFVESSFEPPDSVGFRFDGLWYLAPKDRFDHYLKEAEAALNSLEWL